MPLASLPGTEAAHQLVVNVRNKCTPEEALNVLRELPNPLREGEQPAAAQAAPHNPLKIDVFVQTLLNLGSKSISHSFAAISKFHYVFKVSFCTIFLMHPGTNASQKGLSTSATWTRAQSYFSDQ